MTVLFQDGESCSPIHYSPITVLYAIMHLRGTKKVSKTSDENKYHTPGSSNEPEDIFALKNFIEFL